MKAIILAGGRGERLKPLTDDIPKPLLKIHEKPIIEHAINNFKKYKITDIILAIGYRAEKIKEYFKDGSGLGVDITYCIENYPLGTGGAIKKASENISEDFIAINGDNMADFDWKKIIETHKKNKAKITMSLYPVDDVTQFGIAEIDGEKIIRFIEKPNTEEAPSNLNNAGGYIINPDCLAMLPDGKSSIEKDCFEKLCQKGVVYAYIHKGRWFPTDTLEKYKKAEKEWKSD